MTQVAIGIDIGGTTSDFAFVDRDGQCLARGTMRTDIHANFQSYLDDLIQSIDATRAEFGGELEVVGCGVGAPNANYFTGTVMDAPNLSWKGTVPVAQMVAERLGVPTVLTNDANAAALGEMLFGSAQGLKDFILVTLGTGLGTGFVSGGNLIYGHDGFAGELGHVIVEPGGRECGCGRRGCLETYVSVTGLMRTARELLKQQGVSEMAGVSVAELRGEDVNRAALAGDELALETFARTGERLGLALANAVAITSPKAIVLFGGLVAAGDLILDPTRAAFEKNLLNIYTGVDLTLSGMKGSDAAVQGAAALSWMELEEQS
ncbi:MAG: glucokinase [Planctomycetota bacterium]|jgi:glucokinase